MKMFATLQVEFEAQEGADQIVLEAALTRGITELRRGIEFGTVGMTNIKSNSTTVDVTAKKIE